MPDGGFHANPQALEGIAGQLRNGAHELEGASGGPPPAPRVSISADKVGDTLSEMMETAAGLMAGMQENADSVHASSGSYREIDNQGGQQFKQQESQLRGPT